MRLLSIVAVVCLAPVAAAEDYDKRIANYEIEARALATDLPRPSQLSSAGGERKLVDAEVAFATGDYDTAALLLFDLIGKPTADQDTATYYLAEALFQKGDRGAARGYFGQIVAKSNVSSKYYQPALLRLIELSILQKDDSEVPKYMAALDAVSPGLRLPAVPYVRGKYAFAKDKHDEALAYFQGVQKGTDSELQAQYFLATTYVAKLDLAKATELFTDIINRKPKSSNDKRVIELSQLALGRLYYERDQPSKSIDSYLLVDRHSDLFPDALYEVAWVYVKGKQYDKALRALELLSLSDPQSTKTPTVRILEGNLRIRKAQMIRAAAVAGTLEQSNKKDDPATEYDKAAQVFTETHDAYAPSYDMLKQIVDANVDTTQYLAQIAGRSPHVFQATALMPEAAAQWLRDEPEVQRIVSIQTDLNDIQTNIDQAEATIQRLEGVLAANDRSSVYPNLAARRSRAATIADDLLRIRGELADQQLRLVDSSGELAQLTANRKQLQQQYTALGNPQQAHTDRVSQAQAKYDEIDTSAAEVDGILNSTQAVAVALRKYANDADPPIPADQKANIAQTLDQIAKDEQAIENELAAIQREVALGRDLAGVGDPAVVQARDLRRKLRAAGDAEHRVLAGFASASRDSGKSKTLVALADRVTRLLDQLDGTEQQIDAIVTEELGKVKGAIAQERQNLAQYKSELAGFETESRDVSGTVLGASFRSVKAKFYDVVVRTDVGNVDVSWSQKEDTDDDLKRLNLARQREVKQLRDEFKDIIEDKTTTPAAPKQAPKPVEPPPPSGSPDQGKAGARVKPGSDTTPTPAAPTVQPDDQKKKTTPKKGAAPKGTAPKDAAPKGGTP